jgi:hypothetical protein
MIRLFIALGISLVFCESSSAYRALALAGRNSVDFEERVFELERSHAELRAALIRAARRIDRLNPGDAALPGLWLSLRQAREVAENVEAAIGEVPYTALKTTAGSQVELSEETAALLCGAMEKLREKDPEIALRAALKLWIKNAGTNGNSAGMPIMAH